MNPGDVVGKRFEIQHLAGSGGIGAVYQALDLTTGTPVALKLLLGAQLHDERLRFEREAGALAELEHPGIVRYVAHGQTRKGRPYLAMQWIEGESLANRLGRGPLTADETLVLGVRLGQALGAAHARGIVHRDLKPSNVVLAGGAIDGATIIDFGLAVLPDGGRATVSGIVVGTPAYMAPEQARGERAIDVRTDVFALGCILHECLAGKPAFDGGHIMAVLAKIALEDVPTLRDLGLAVTASFDGLVSRMLMKDRAARPPDGAAVAALLLAGETGGAAALETAGLTGVEERLVCVVLARAPRDAEPSPMSDTLLLSGVARVPPAVLAPIEARGGIAAVLVDGTIAVTASGTGLATDQAARAAGYARILREGLPAWAIAVATGRAQLRAQRPAGEAIELAARRIRARQKTSGPAPIDLDEVTAGLLDLRFDVTAGALGLELAGERDVAEEARTLLGRPTATVGRDREIDTLGALFEESLAEPSARAVLVTAPAGGGKSRLRHELVKRIAARGVAEIWIARGDPARSGAPFGLVAQLVRGAARLYDGEPVEARRQKLSARVSRHVTLAERRRVAEFLGELCGTPFPDEDRTELRAARHDPRLAGDQMRRAWLDLVDAETSAGPLVLVLEDMHWGDAPSAEYVDEALRLLSDRPLMVLALARPEVGDRLPKLWQERAALEVRLPPLNRRACEKLARAVLGDDVAAETVKELWERSGGNAFFLEELLRATAEGRGGELPGTVLAMVESRLDALDPEDRRLLRAASVFGGVFWRGGVRALLGGEDGLDGRLRRLEHKEWIARRATPKFRGEEEYALRHATVREAAYGMLTAADRALGHRLAAAWLEEAGETDALMLAEHNEAGGAAESAVRWYCVAAEQALEGNDLAGVIARVDRAVALGASGEPLGRLAVARAIAHNWRGEHAEAEPWAATASQLLPRGSPRWFSALAERVWTTADRGDGPALARVVEDLLGSTVDTSTPGPRVTALGHAVCALVVTGRYDDAEVAREEIDAMARRLAFGPVEQGSALVAAHFLSITDARRSISTRPLATAIACFESGGDLRQACLQQINLADAYARMGAYPEAEETARKAVSGAERMKLGQPITSGKINLGQILVRRASLPEARATLVSAIEDCVARNDQRWEVCARIYLAAAMKLGADLAGAENEARRAVDALPPTAPLVALARATLADVLLAGGRPREALEQASLAHAQLASMGQVEEGEALIRLVYAEALDAAGDRDAARAALVVARERVLAEAARIEDESFRRRFVESVPENARTLALAAEWLVET